MAGASSLVQATRRLPQKFCLYDSFGDPLYAKLEGFCQNLGLAATLELAEQLVAPGHSVNSGGDLASALKYLVSPMTGG